MRQLAFSPRAGKATSTRSLSMVVGLRGIPPDAGVLFYTAHYWCVINLIFMQTCSTCRGHDHPDGISLILIILATYTRQYSREPGYHAAVLLNIQICSVMLTQSLKRPYAIGWRVVHHRVFGWRVVHHRVFDSYPLVCFLNTHLFVLA